MRRAWRLAPELNNSYDANGNRAGATVTPGTDTTPPSVPTNLTATAVSQSQVNLSWTASIDDVGITGYRLERCAGSGLRLVHGYGNRYVELPGGPIAVSEACTVKNIDQKKRLTSAIEEFMTRRGWSMSRVRRSCQFFELPIETTPYVFLEPPRKRQEFFEVLGAIGIVNRPFERHWATSHPTETYTDTLATSLHLANFPGLHEARLISIEKMERDVEVLGAELLKILASFPRDEHALRSAFQRGELAGRPIVNFSGYLGREKFRALQEFIGRTQH